MAARRRVKHPLRNFERSTILLFELATEPGDAASGYGTDDKYHPAVPGMPTIENLPPFSNMGVLL